MSLNQETKRQEALCAAADAFVDSRIALVEDMKFETPEWIMARLETLVELIVQLRASVSRDFHRQITHVPAVEIGTRLGKQLLKLGWALCVVDDKERVDWDIFKILRKVAFDTAVGFNQTIVRAMMELGGVRLSVDDIVAQSGLPKQTCVDHMNNLLLLKVIFWRKETRNNNTLGRTRNLWSVKRSVRQAWIDISDEGDLGDDVSE